MTFNTTSFIAGVGSVVVVLSTGFAGGYFIANPTRVDPPNRLQRLAAEDRSKAPAPTQPTAKPEVVAAATPAAAAAPATPVVTPAPSAAPPPTQPASAQPAASPAPAAPAPEAKASEAKAPEPAQTVATREATPPAADKPDADKVTPPKAGADKERGEARYVERNKRGDARKVAEQQRKQRELEVATVAVRRIIHDRDGQDVIIRDRDAPELVENDPPQAPALAMPRLNLFGQ
jgi:hypothetical protein